jgi:hypothetical protein
VSAKRFPTFVYSDAPVGVPFEMRAAPSDGARLEVRVLSAQAETDAMSATSKVRRK